MLQAASTLAILLCLSPSLASPPPSSIITDSFTPQSFAQFKCQYIDANYFVDLQDLSIYANGPYEFSSLLEGYLVSFCETLEDDPCGESSMAVEVDTQGVCQTVLSGDSPKNDAKITVNEANEDNSFPGSVTVVYSGGEVCEDRTYGLEIEITCYEEGSSGDSNLFVNPQVLQSDDACVPKVTF